MPKYICECCNYETDRKSSYDKHNISIKHQKNLQNKNKPKPEPKPEPEPEPEPIKPSIEIKDKLENELIKKFILFSLFMKLLN